MPYARRNYRRGGSYTRTPYKRRSTRYVYTVGGTPRARAIANEPVKVAMVENMVRDKEANENRTSICKVPGLVVPDKTLVKLKYTDRVNMGITSPAVIAIQQYSGNSAFDPNYTGVGGQPNGFDQWATFYRKYCIMASKFKVKLIPLGTTAPTSAMEVVVVPVPSTAIPTGASTNINVLRQQKYACWNVFGQGMDLPRCETYMETGKLYGKSKDAIKAEDNFNALTTADPATEWTWILATAPVDGISTTPCYAYIEIVYYAMFYDRIPITD